MPYNYRRPFNQPFNQQTRVRIKYGKQYFYMVGAGVALGIIAGGILSLLLYFPLYNWIYNYHASHGVSIKYLDWKTKNDVAFWMYLIKVVSLVFCVERMMHAFGEIQRLLEKKIKLRIMLLPFAKHIVSPHNELADLIWAVYYSFSQWIFAVVAFICTYAITQSLSGQPTFFSFLASISLGAFASYFAWRLNEIFFGAYVIDQNLENLPLIGRTLEHLENSYKLNSDKEKGIQREYYSDDYKH